MRNFYCQDNSKDNALVSSQFGWRQIFLNQFDNSGFQPTGFQLNHYIKKNYLAKSKSPKGKRPRYTNGRFAYRRQITSVVFELTLNLARLKKDLRIKKKNTFLRDLFDIRRIRTKIKIAIQFHTNKQRKPYSVKASFDA